MSYLKEIENEAIKRLNLTNLRKGGGASWNQQRSLNSVYN